MPIAKRFSFENFQQQIMYSCFTTRSHHHTHCWCKFTLLRRVRGFVCLLVVSLYAMFLFAILKRESCWWNIYLSSIGLHYAVSHLIWCPGQTAVIHNEFLPGWLKCLTRYVLIWISIIRFRCGHYCHMIAWWSMCINSSTCWE